MAKKHPQIDTREIVARFGGSKRLWDLLLAYGYRQIGLSAIEQWKVRGQIGGMWVPVLLDIAEREGIELSPRDFMEGGEHPNELLL